MSPEALWTPSPEGSLLDAYTPGNRGPITRLSTGHDADWFRDALKDNGIRPCILGRQSRAKPVRHDRRRYRHRNRVEIVFGRLMDSPSPSGFNRWRLDGSTSPPAATAAPTSSPRQSPSPQSSSCGHETEPDAAANAAVKRLAFSPAVSCADPAGDGPGQAARRNACRDGVGTHVLDASAECGELAGRDRSFACVAIRRGNGHQVGRRGMGPQGEA